MRPIFRYATAGIACLFAAAAYAQGPQFHLPEAPQPTLTEHLLYAGDASARGFDVYTTHEMLENPYDHESILPNAIADHTAALAAFDGGVSYVIYRVSRFLDMRGHHRLALLIPALDIAGAGYIDIHNNYISGEKPPVHYDEPLGWIPGDTVQNRR